MAATFLSRMSVFVCMAAVLTAVVSEEAAAQAKA